MMQDKDDLLTRLRKVEGQIRGIQKMIAEDRDCADVIRQVVAASRALDKVGFMVTSRSLKNCLSRSAATGKDPGIAMDDALKMLFAVAKSGG
jgi:CsoR family transcriptional regulator, copper-sensing transcriptional repressor